MFFTNDMLSILDDSINVYNYADDNTLMCTGYNYEHVEDKLILNVCKVIKWFESNFMKVHPDKFQYIIFGKVKHICMQVHLTSMKIV